MKGCEEICDCCPDCCKKYWNKNKPGKEITKENEEEEEEEGEKEDDFLNEYIEAQKEKELQYKEEIEKQKEEIEKQKEELKNKMREYLNYVKKQVENISHNIGEENAVGEDLFDQIFKINKLIENFQDDEYFNTNLIEKIQEDLEELQELCSQAGIINLDDFCKENEEWEKFLEDNGIQEKYEEEKIITPEKFLLNNTLEKLKNNFGTYLLEIFKTRLFPTNKNGNKDKYKNEFMEFYEKKNIATWISSLTEESFIPFYEKICEKTSNGLDTDISGKCRNLLLADKYLGFALLSDGDESQIFDAFYNNINSFDNMKRTLIALFIDCFKRNIVEIIKDSLQEQLNVNKNLQKNISENIKNLASEKYKEAIENLNGETIDLTFYNSYATKMATDTFFKACELSVLFDYVLSKGREFYASDGEEEDLGCVNYEDEKGKLELKTALGLGSESLNNAINNSNDITIGEFYEKQSPNVYMLFNL